MKPYPLQLEIAGPIALWARPDTLPNPVSYVAPTFSAAKGIFEGSAGASPASAGAPPTDSLVRWKSVNVRPTRCEICAPVQFHRYAFNYGGPLRKSGQIKDGTSLPIFAQALINVCYRLHADVDWNRGPNGKPAESPDGQCAPHAYVDAFQRRLERGRWFYTPCLGCFPSPALFAGEGGRRPGEGRCWQNSSTNYSSAVPDYVGPFRDGTAPCATENHVIPAFLKMVFDHAHSIYAN